MAEQPSAITQSTLSSPPSTSKKKVFHFKQWLTDCNLKAVESILIEYNMTTLDTLSMHNENLSRLLSDKRVCSNSKLVSMVVIHLQSLDANKGTYNSSNAICKFIDKKLQKISNLERELHELTQRHKEHRHRQLQYFQRSQAKYLVDSNKARKRIIHSFSALYDVLKNKEHALLTEVAKFNIELDAISMNRSNIINANNDSNAIEDINAIDGINDNEYDDEKGVDPLDRTFTTKYNASNLIVNDCKQYLTEQLDFCQSRHFTVNQRDEMMKKIRSRFCEHESRFNAHREWMKRRIRHIEENQFNINSINFTLNEFVFSNIIKEIDHIGELRKYKKVEVDIERIEWMDPNHVQVHFEFVNLSTLETVEIEQYEIQYRYFDVHLQDADDSMNGNLDWKTILFPSWSKSKNTKNTKNGKRLNSKSKALSVINPLKIQIEAPPHNNGRNRMRTPLVSSNNDTVIWMKMRVKHSPHFLWSSYSNTLKEKVANYLIVEKGQIVRLRVDQRKRKKSKEMALIITQRGTLKKALTAPSSPTLNLNAKSMAKSNSVGPRKSNTDEVEGNSSRSISGGSKGSQSNSSKHSMKELAAKYHQYYTFDTVIIKEGGTLTIDENEGDSERGAVHGIYSKLSTANSENGKDGDDGNDDDDDEEQQNKPKGYLHLVIERDLVIERGGSLTVSGMGYSGGGRYESGDSVNSCGEMGETQNNGGGGGGSKTYELGCGGGGGYGTNGDNGCSGKGFGFGSGKTKYREDIDGRGGRAYGDTPLSVCHFGSGGGGGDYGDSTGGNGGGIIIVDCGRNVTMHDESVMTANGEKGKYESDGCGSGGSIFIKCKSLQMKHTAKIEAVGGRNGLKGNGGDGGSGRIRIKCQSENVPWSKCNIAPRPFLG